MSEAVEHLLRSGLHGRDAERRLVEKQLGMAITRETWSNLVQRTKRELGVTDSTQDFKGLLEWLQREIRKDSAVARYRVSGDVGYEVDGVFYMSADMVYHLGRNGTVLVMDTTFKTNRFHWPLLLVCGINEHGQTILLAVALLHHQTTDAFTWALQQMKGSVSEEDWTAITCIFTDGDQAMSAAIGAVLPHVHHLRCIWHVEQNLRSNVKGFLSLTALEEFITSWKRVVGEEDLQAFDRGKEQLYLLCPQARSYMERHHWINEQLFALCYTKYVTTFGIRGTSRVEGFNSQLKGMFGVKSTTSLEILFDSLQYAASQVERNALRVATLHANRHPPTGDGRTIAQETHPHLSYYAGELVRREFELQHNYQAEQKTVGERDNVWIVWERRVTSAEPEKRREVQVGDDYMRCSCCFPVTYLLPCRHVLAVNLLLFRTAFRPTQVGKRWLRYHRTAPSAPIPVAQHPYLLPPASSPSLLTALTQHAAFPLRSARYGQLWGYCQTICNQASEFKDAFFPTLKKVQELVAFVEGLTSSTGHALVQNSPSSTSSTELPAPALTEMHPSISPEQLTLPEHRKKQPGREKQSREKGKGEKAAKRQRVSASQQ